MLWLIIVLAIVDGTFALAGRALTRAAAAAVLKPSGQLREGNALLNIGFTVAGAIGPAAAGVVVAAFGVRTALLVEPRLSSPPRSPLPRPARCPR